MALSALVCVGLFPVHCTTGAESIKVSLGPVAVLSLTSLVGHLIDQPSSVSVFTHSLSQCNGRLAPSVNSFVRALCVCSQLPQSSTHSQSNGAIFASRRARSCCYATIEIKGLVAITTTREQCLCANARLVHQRRVLIATKLLTCGSPLLNG